MRLSISEALEVLNVKGLINQQTIKKTYRKLAQQYHPDRNPNGLKAMQEINVAYNYLSNISDVLLQAYNAEEKKPNQQYKTLYDVIVARGLSIYEDENQYTWVKGKTYYHKEFLKSQGFRWNPIEKGWWRPK